MKQLMGDIIEEVKTNGELSARKLDRIIAVHNRRFRDEVKHFAKKQLAPYYLEVKQNDPKTWDAWGLSETQERVLLAAIQMKPRRTASGVATITVITKPWPCAGNCIYCPNDVRMPKSYLHAEPACQRAERNYFDPYLQVASRLSALERMGHATDKVELIVLGGSFTDYPQDYQIWFIHELFRALNDADAGFEGVGDVFGNSEPKKPHGESPQMVQKPNGDSPQMVQMVQMAKNRTKPDASIRYQTAANGSIPVGSLAQEVAKRMAIYKEADIVQDEEALKAYTQEWQQRVGEGATTYNKAIEALYGAGSVWDATSNWQIATLEQLKAQQVSNESASHRVVGLVVETRPNAIDAHALTLLRQLGCTKLQMGVQTLNEEVAAHCQRPTPIVDVRKAFELTRAFGFKSHAHFMANLPGATPEGDIADYRAFVHDASIAPDEVKLYPCVLLDDTALKAEYVQGSWQPYAEETLVEVLANDILATPAHTRISRMIRDFSSGDIVAGNKKTNLRQMVEQHVEKLVAQGAAPVQEIRMREVATNTVEAADLCLEEHFYETSNTHEIFLQWVAPAPHPATQQNIIAGFLRLSLPKQDWLNRHTEQLPIHAQEAMIREVHVYGAAARLHSPTHGAQHQGLGRALVERACEIAREANYMRINVISAIGTRDYYRALAFKDNDLYLTRML